MSTRDSFYIVFDSSNHLDALMIRGMRCDTQVIWLEGLAFQDVSYYVLQQ